MVEAMANPDRRAVLSALVTLAELDLPYAELYLWRAEMVLQPLCTREAHAHGRREEAELQHLVGDFESGSCTSCPIFAQTGAWRLGTSAGEWLVERDRVHRR